MKFISEYWSQVTVIIGSMGFLLKTIFEYRLKNKELRFKYFYELKSQKIIELYSKIVEIQMIVDRRKKDDAPSFESNMFKKRRELDIIGKANFTFQKVQKKYFAIL